MSRENGSVSAVDTRSLTERVYDQLRQSLLQGQLPSGESMTIRSMASELGTSEMPVREAMKRLLAERMIVQRHNRSFQVPELKESDFEELIEIRVSIEGSAARQAVANADDALVVKLTQHNIDMKTSLEAGDSASVLKGNQEFHFALYQSAKSEILMQLIELLWMRSGPYLAQALAEIQDAKSFFVKATETHEKLISALIARDKDRVVEALEEDLQSTAQWYKDHIAMKAADEKHGSSMA